MCGRQRKIIIIIKFGAESDKGKGGKKKKKFRVLFVLKVVNPGLPASACTWLKRRVAPTGWGMEEFQIFYEIKSRAERAERTLLSVRI